MFFTTLKLALRNGLESLCLTPEMTLVVVKYLDNVWTSYKNTAELVQEVGGLLPDFVSKMLIKRYEHIFVQDKLLYKFAQQVFPQICSSIDNDIKRQMKTAVDEKMEYLTDEISKLEDPTLLPPLVSDLILLYSILELIFSDPQMKTNILQNNQKSLSFFKTLLENRAQNILNTLGGPQLDQLFELVQRIG